MSESAGKPNSSNRGEAGRSRISDVVRAPARTFATRDRRYLASGKSLNEPATAYFREDGNYVVVNDVSGEVVQISDTTRHWLSPFDEGASEPERSSRGEPDDCIDSTKTMRFVEKCEADDVAVLGIEGFVREPDGVRPQLDLIADFSPDRLPSEVTWEEYRPTVNRRAREFLEAARSRADVVFDFVTWSQDDWLVRRKPTAGEK